jgi:ADP-ribosylglycohydrolase
MADLERPIGFQERAVACFKGLASGDAVGKQTEMLTRRGVEIRYPGGITGFHGQPGDVIPRYVGKRYAWRIGETTDDTEQTLAVARAILRERKVSHEAIGKELLHCKKSLHPGVSLWAFHERGDPARIASEGDGCGAAMRVAPVGVIYPSSRLHDLIQGAYECSIPTHGGQLAICAAAAVACAISAALDGKPAAEVLEAALKASREAEALRPSKGKPGIADCLKGIHSALASRKQLLVDEIAQRYFPDTPLIIVPLAISLAVITESSEQTILIAANLGGDSDSVASIGGAIAAALRPQTVNPEWFEVVNSINPSEVVEIAISLAAMR